jgi:hypothetical protein
MSNIRTEVSSVSQDASVDDVRFGPWPQDVLIRSVYFTVHFEGLGSPGRRLPHVYVEQFPGQPIVHFPASTDEVPNYVADFDGKATAFPGAGVSPLFDSAHAIIINGYFAIPISYNLIIPQRGRLVISILGAQPGDLIMSPVLCLEYAGITARPKAGAPLSSKNNP